MMVRCTLLIISFITIFSTVITKGITNKSSTIIKEQTNENSCSKDYFPLFGTNSCIPRIAYTIIFLATIVLSGISFLILTILLLLFCIQQCAPYDSSYDNDKESSILDVHSSDDDDDSKSILPSAHTDRQISNVLKTIINTPSYNDSTQTRIDHNYRIPASFCSSTNISNPSFDTRPSNEFQPSPYPYNFTTKESNKYENKISTKL